MWSVEDVRAHGREWNWGRFKVSSNLNQSGILWLCDSWCSKQSHQCGVGETPVMADLLLFYLTQGTHQGHTDQNVPQHPQFTNLSTFCKSLNFACRVITCGFQQRQPLWALWEMWHQRLLGNLCERKSSKQDCIFNHCADHGKVVKPWNRLPKEVVESP